MQAPVRTDAIAGRGGRCDTATADVIRAARVAVHGQRRTRVRIATQAPFTRHGGLAMENAFANVPDMVAERRFRLDRAGAR